MNVHGRIAAAMLFALAGISGCEDSKKGSSNNNPPQTTVVGQVTDWNTTTGVMTPIAGASVTAIGLADPQETDADGYFAITLANPPEATVLLAAAAGYGDAYRRIFLVRDTANTVAFALKAKPANQTVTLGGAGTGAVTVTGADGLASVIIEPGDLIEEGGNGTAIEGSIDVSLVSYDPEVDWLQLPTPLATPTDAGLKPLYSFGMSELELFQAGKKLNVANTKALTWVFTVNPARRPWASGSGPAIYWFNAEPAVFAWQEYGTWTYNDGTGKVTAEVPHLSALNYDYLANTSCFEVSVQLPASLQGYYTPTIDLPSGIPASGFSGGAGCGNVACPNQGGTTFQPTGNIVVTLVINGHTYRNSVAMPQIRCDNNYCGNDSPCGNTTIEFTCPPERVMSNGAKCNKDQKDFEEGSANCCPGGSSCEDGVCAPDSAN